jgi:putative ABC transport system permease protein
MRLTSWCLAAAWRLMPRAFRNRFGSDFAEVSHDLARDARARGGRSDETAYIVREVTAITRLALGLRRQHANRRGLGSRGAILWTAFGDDIWWAARLARRRPIVAFAITSTLAVAIAAATTAYGLATAVLWRPLPFRDASQLVFVWEDTSADASPRASRLTPARFADWRDRSTAFASLAQFGAAGFTTDGPDGVSAIRGVRVSASYFDTLGIRPLLGRTFIEADQRPGQHQVIVLSHALWQQRFGGRSAAVGDTIRLSGQPYTVVGVMPPVVLPAWPVNPAVVRIEPDLRQFWIPIARTPDADQNARSHVFGAIGRLAPGVSLDRAADELNRLSPGADPHRAHLTPLREQFVRDARAPFLALLGAALAVLLIACANLAALQVTALEARQAELSVRTAIGAGRGRLVRQLGTESLAFAGVGGLAGIGLARVALATLPERLPASMPFLTSPAVDLPVAAAGMSAAVLSGLVLAAWPIARVRFAGPQPRGASPRPRGFVYRALVVSQVALTSALVVSAALLAQSMWSVQAEEPGFRVRGVLVADLSLPSERYRQALDVLRFEERLLGALASVSGIRGVATAYDHPLEANWTDAFTLSGDTTRDVGEISGQAELRIVSPSYFDAVDVEVLDGRRPSDRDDLTAPGAVVVNEAFAHTFGASGPVLGRRLQSQAARLTWGDRVPAEFTIVGIVENERFRGLERPPQPAVYESTRQFPQQGFSVLMRTDEDVRRMMPQLREVVKAIDAEVAVSNSMSLERVLAEQLGTRRLTTHVIGGFAAAALGLAALGLYGLLAVLVAASTRDIGIRLALGASPELLAREVVGESVRNAATGVAAGLALALVAGRLLQSLLVGVTARDPFTLAVVGITLPMVALLAALVPAIRAARVDPARALRAD